MAHRKFNREQIAKSYESGQSVRQVSKNYSCSEWLVYTSMQEYSVEARGSNASPVEKRPKAKCDHTYFSNIDSEEKAYWLGFIVADGNIHNNRLRISLAVRDRQHLELFRRAIGSKNSIIEQQMSGYADTLACTFAVRSVGIAEDLAKFGVVPRKTYDMQLNLSSVPAELHKHFWRGMIDGDGCLGLYMRGANNLRLTSTVLLVSHTKQPLYLFQDFCEAIVGSKPRILDHNGSFVCRLSSLVKIDKLLRMMYTGCNVGLERKIKKSTTILEKINGY